ncbi:MAG TPA: LamG-like jellyroll fold domain-containing protein, partial [Pseudonocardiaceae bacterium]
IKLVGLAWGAPGWIGNGTFLSTDMINYLISWLGCAKQNNVPVAYLTAAQNEHTWGVNWTISLHNALNAAGFSGVKIIVGDQLSPNWVGADQVPSNPTFAGAVDVLSAHYPCGYLGPQSNCPASASATASGKVLWASENGSQDFNGGAPELARGINRGYIDGKMTAYLNWNLIAAITPNIPWPTVGLMLANQPWSGNYAVGKDLWAMAHTTQFTAPGWHYLDTSSGYLNGNRGNGSYVSLKSPNNSDYSTIIETVDATTAQTLNFTVAGGLSTGTVHVWSTNLNSANPADYFVHAADITLTGGSFSLTVQPGFLYSVTTTTGQGKGTATGPAPGSLALPYRDSFDSYPTGAEPRYLMAMQGAFEANGCDAGRAGTCVRQNAPQTPILWKQNADPYALLGSTNWANYTVSSDVLLEKPGYVELIGRAGAENLDPCGLNAYYLRVTDTGSWSILRNNSSCAMTTLASGTTAALGTNRWHTLALTLAGNTITASVDGTTVASATDTTWSVGQVGYATSQGETA